MKKLCLAVLLVTITVLLCGAPVSSEEAIEVGQKWMHHVHPDRQAIQFEQIQTITADDIFLIYILSIQGGGWLLLSADDSTYPILGYSDTGSFEYPITCPAVEYWINVYTGQIAEAVTENYPNTETRPIWDSILTGTLPRWDNSRAVSPLLTTTWNQDNPYNNYCPNDASGPGGHAYAGCVATAMAQVMKKWNWPTQGINYHSYTDGSTFPPSYGTIGVSFNVTHNWASMPNSITTPDNDICTLIYHCGVAVDMDYGTAASGALAFTNDAMEKYFSYDPAANWQYRSSYTDPVWDSMMKSDLALGRPIIYQGYNSGNTTGHSFVMDGHNDNSPTQFHFNFGWGGLYNGYFTLNGLIPVAGFDFRYFQWAYFNIYPGVSVSGTITDSFANPLSGVTVSFSGAGSAVTDANGFYSMTLSQSYTGTATPSLSGYAFTPASLTYNNLTTIQTNQNYSGSPAVPAAPTNLNANVISYSQIDLSWTDNSNNENGFTIEYRVGFDLTWYYLTWVSSDVTYFQHMGLLPSTNYAHRVMAFNGAGNSAYAYSTPVTTLPPPAPINLNTTGITQSSAILNWTELGTPYNWEIEFGPAGFTLGTGIFYPGIVTNPYNLIGLTPGTSYDWYVRSSYGVAATSPWAGPCNFTTLAPNLPYPWSENFEAGFVNLVNDPVSNTPWNIHAVFYSEGVQSAHNAYQASNTNILVTSSTFDLSTALWPMLYFDQIAIIEDNWDHGYVEISTDGGLTWIILPPSTYQGNGQYIPPLYNNPEGPCFMQMSYPDWNVSPPNNSLWKAEAFDLSSYVGIPNAMIRFRLKSDSSIQQYGWLIDNVEVKEAPQYSFTVIPPIDAHVGLGLSHDYLVTVVNTGLMADSYSVSLQGVGAWFYGLYEADGTSPLNIPINLPPSAAYNFVVKVTTPAGGVNNYDMDYESFMVMSQSSGTGYTHLLGTMVLIGDTINDAIVIGSLPFTHTGSTVNYNHDFGPYGDVSGLVNLINSPTSYYASSTLGSSPDVVYQLTLSAPTMLSIDLLGSTYDTAVALVTNPGTAPVNVLLVNDDYYTTPVNFVSYVDTGCNAVPAGTYYIIVGGYGSASGNYTLTVTAAPIPVAPSVTVSYDIAADQIVLSWTQNTVMRYNIYSDTNPYGSFSNVIATGVNAANYTIPGIPPIQNFYKVTERFCYPGSRMELAPDKALPSKE